MHTDSQIGVRRTTLHDKLNHCSLFGYAHRFRRQLNADRVHTYATPPLEQSSALHRTASSITALSPIFCMHAPGCCDSQTVPPIQLDPAAFVASSDAMACMACSSYTSTGTFVMLYSTQRAHAVGVYIRSRRKPKHKDDLHFAPIKNTRTPAKPRIQYVQNPASFCCRSGAG